MVDDDHYPFQHYIYEGTTPGMEVTQEVQLGLSPGDGKLRALRALYAEYHRDNLQPKSFERVMSAVSAPGAALAEDEGEVTMDLRARGLVG